MKNLKEINIWRIKGFLENDIFSTRKEMEI
jgi:hypothetical protein